MKVSLTIALLMSIIHHDQINAIKIKTVTHDPEEDKALAAIGAAINAET
jgi:hypothetical protein